MALRTSLDNVPDSLRDYLSGTLNEGESFVVAMPTADGNGLFRDYVPWFALTTDRLIHFQSFLWRQTVQEVSLGDVTRVEQQRSFLSNKWALYGNGINNSYKTSNSATDDFVSQLRDTL